jgi:hypothetical protein
VRGVHPAFVRIAGDGPQLQFDCLGEAAGGTDAQPCTDAQKLSHSPASSNYSFRELHLAGIFRWRVEWGGMKFNVQDLFWLMLVVALVCGWWMDRFQLRDWHDYRFRRLKETVERSLVTQNQVKVRVDADGKVTDYENNWP